MSGVGRARLGSDGIMSNQDCGIPLMFYVLRQRAAEPHPGLEPTSGIRRISYGLRICGLLEASRTRLRIF
jgi:hypothetical protein